MRVALLGPVALLDGERAVAVPGEKQRTLLALLALAAGEPVSSDALVDQLWPDAVPGDPTNALQARISAVRKVVGRDMVSSSAAGYALSVDAEDVDACRFERLVEAGRRALDEGDCSVASERLEEAVTLWAGEVALADVPREGRVQLAAERLEDLLADAHEARIDAELALGRHERAAADLRTLVAQHPLRERFREQLMLALYRSGRQADALAAYQDARRTFAEELGLDPGPALSALEDAILRHDTSLLPGPTARATIRRPLTSFVGRAGDLDGVEAALAKDRLVTIVGPGGVGKTRLATEVALRADLPTWWVSLDAVTDASGLRPAIATAIGIGEDQLEPWIGDRSMLLVLDNCEQVVAAVAEVVGTLLGATSSLRFLATSREVLGVGGEVVWMLDGLPADEAAELFEARAPSTSGDAAVPGLCEDLDGLPLAIELAAARTNVLSPADIAARLGNRFTVLTDGQRTAAPRHQTLRALVDWSYELLFDDERRALAAVSVFRNRFGIADAEAVCLAVGLERDDIVDVIGRLAAKSLVIADRGSLRLLVTIRDYGAERLVELGAEAQVRRAHAVHLAALATSLSPSLMSADQVAAIDVLAARDDDLNAALDWCEAADEPGTGLSLMAALGWYWYLRGGWKAARRRLEWALRSPVDDVVTRGYGFGWLAHFALVIDADVDAALEAAREQHACGVAARDDLLRAQADVHLIRAHYMAGAVRAVAEPLDEATQLLTGQDEPFWMGMCHYFASLVALSGGRLEEAEPLIAEALACFKRSGERWSMYNALQHGGTVLELAGRLDEAATWFAEALVHAGSLRLRVPEGHVRLRLARVSEALGDADGAAAVCEQCLDLAAELDDGTLLNVSRVTLARAERARGHLEEADELTAAALRSPQARNRDLFLFATNERGFVRELQGHREEALALHQETLQLAADSSDARYVTWALVGVAGCVADQERAATLLGAAEAFRGSPVPGAGAERRYAERVEGRCRDALGPAFDAAIDAGRRLTTEEAIALALTDVGTEPAVSRS